MKPVGEPPDKGTIYPIVSQIPATIDKGYLTQHLIPKELIEQLRDGLLTETLVWSQEESAKIATGRGGKQGEPLALSEGTHAPAQGQIGAPGAPLVPNHDDPLVQQPQVAWITHQYCGDDQQKVRQICDYFGVPSLDQLRMSHFRTLVSQAQNG
jgi:hypothetical protein